MSEELSYQNTLDDYNTQIADYKQQALALWANAENAGKLVQSIAGEVGGPMAFEYGRDLVGRALTSKSALAAKDKLVEAGTKVKDAVVKGAKNVAEVAKDKAVGLVKDTTNKVTNIADNLKNGATAATDSAKAIVSDSASAAKGAVNSVRAAADSLVEEGGTKLSSAYGAGVRNINSAVDEARAGVQNGLSAAEGGLQEASSGFGASGFNPGPISDAGGFTDEVRSSLNDGLQYTGRGVEQLEVDASNMTTNIGRGTGTFTKLSDLKQSNGVLGRWTEKMRQPRVTARGRVNIANDTGEFEDGPYSLVNQGPTRVISGSRFSGLVSDGYGKALGSARSVVDDAGNVARSIVPQVAEVEGEAARVGNSVAATVDAVSTGAKDVANTVGAAAKVGETVEDIQRVAGAGKATAEAALETGATAIKDGKQLIGGATAAASEAGGEVADAGVAAAEGVGAALDEIPVADIAGLALGAGALLYSIFGGSHSEPTVELPNYSQPVESLGL